MSSQTNIPINSRSMNGIITISDGGGTTIENGEVTTTNLFAPNVATLSENETISGIYTFTPNLPQSSVVPTLGAQLVNKTYVDGLAAGYVTIAGSQTLLAGIKTFTNLPECSTAATTANQLTNKTYVDGLDAQNVKLSGAQTIAGIKTFSSLPESSVVPTTANQLTNKTYVDGLDAQNVKLSGAQTIAGIKTFSSLPESSVVPTTANQLVNKTYADGVTSGFVTLATTQTISGDKTFSGLLRSDSATNGSVYLGSGANELTIRQITGDSYWGSKGQITFNTNQSGLGTASRVGIVDEGLVIFSGQKLYLDTTTNTYIDSAGSLMRFFVPTSNQFKWLVNSVQCALLDAGGLTLVGGLKIGNGQNIEMNTSGTTISSTGNDITYQAITAAGNHYFNIGASNIVGVSTTALTIQDTKILQLGSVNTTNIQKSGVARLDYNVPTGMTHSLRINSLEAVGISSTKLAVQGSIEHSGTINTTYTAAQTYVAASVGYIYSGTIVASGTAVTSAGTNVGSIASLPIGVYALSYQINFQNFGGAFPVGYRAGVGTASGNSFNIQARLYDSAADVNQRGLASTFFYNNTTAKTIYLNGILNSVFSSGQVSSDCYFQAMKIA